MDRKTNISRRKFLNIITIPPLCSIGCIFRNDTKNNSDSETISFGMIADTHYADKNTWGTRYYRDSDEKLVQCIETFNELKPSFIIELGDFIDDNVKEIEIGYLKKIDSIFSQFNGDRYYVLGNHDMSSLSKEEFLSVTSAHGKYYSFDYSSFHFVVLDGNYNGDGSDYNAGNFYWTETYINTPQLEWLRNDLEKASNKTTIVFTHQNIHNENDNYRLNNAREVRLILEQAGNVCAVFQGHYHNGGYNVVNGIHYVTLQGAVENPGLENNKYALTDADRDNIKIEGYGKQNSYELKV